MSTLGSAFELRKKKDIKTKNMHDLSLWLNELRIHPKLTYLFVELTQHCNLTCLHCGSSCAPGKGKMLDKDLLCHALKTIAEDFEVSKVMICLTGGEPMLHPQFWEIIQYIHQLGFPWGMTTNGTLIKAYEAQRLKECGIGSITLSIDGIQKSHDALRGVHGSFERAIRGVQALKAEGIPVQITSVIHKKNLNELDQLFDLMKSLNIASWRVINLEPIGRALEHKDLLLARNDFFELLAYIRQKRFDPDVTFDVRYGCSHYLSFDYEREVRDNYFICGSGIYVGSILCNGDIFSCLDIERRPELIQGNIANDRFSDVWHHRFQAFRMDRSAKCAECLNCAERAFCHGDSAHTWDFTQNKPMFCILQQE